MKKIMILLFALALLTSVFADVITIGAGTIGTYEPMSSYYGYHRSATIYTAGQVGGSGTINTIAYKASTTSTNAVPIKVFMKMTTAATLAPAASWPTLITGLTPVYEGTISGTTTGQWKTITLTTPFAYTGNNLEILIESNYGGGGGSSPHPQWFYSTAANQNQYIRADNTAPTTATGTVNSSRPDVQLDISGYTTFPPAFAVTPTSVAFGNVNMNTTTAYTNVTVSNNGAGTLNVTSAVLGGADAARFILDMNSNPLPWALTAGQSKIVKVAFNPTAGAVYSAYLRFGDDLRADHDVALTGTGVDPAISTFPTVYDFGTLSTDAFPPFNWTRYSGVLADPIVLGAEGTGYWRQDDWLNNTTIANKAARLEIYSTWNGWLISPPINVPGNDYEVMFDVAYMYYSSNNPPNTTGIDDKFAVLVGDGTSWTTANVVRQWDNAGSPYILNNIPPAGMTVSLPLGTAGTKYVAFYAGSTASNADNDIMVDNITFRQTPSNPIFALSPNISSWDFGATMVNTAATKQFTITNIGGGTLNIGSVIASGAYYSISVAPADVALTAGESTTFTVQYLPTAAGATHPGTLTITDNRAVTTVTLTGSCFDPTITTFPFVEGFETGNTDASTTINQWTQVTGPEITGKYWTANGSQTEYNRTPRTGAWNATLQYNGQSNLFRPIELTAGTAYSIELYARQDTNGPNDAKIQVKYGAEASIAGMTETIIPATGVIDGDYQRFYGVFSPATTGLYYIGIQGWANFNPWYISLDDITIDLGPVVPILAYSPETIDFGGTFTNTPTDYQNVTVSNDGGGALDLAVADISLLGANTDQFDFTTTIGFPATLAVGESVSIPVRFAPTSLGDKTATLRISYDGTDYDVALNGTALSETALFESFEGGVIPSNWTVLNADGGTKVWEASTTLPRTGIYSARVGYESSSLTNDDWLITPPLLVTSGATDNISFWMRSFDTPYDDPWEVLISTTDTDPASFTMIDEGDGMMGSYVQKSYNLDSYGDATVYLAIRYIGLYEWSLYVDDFVGPEVYFAPIPPEAVTLSSPADGATGLPKAGFNLTWTPASAGGVPSFYQLFIASSAETIYEEEMFDGITGTSFNPVVDGGMTFNFEDRWFWTVQAVNTYGEAVVDPPHQFVIEADPAITTFPWNEGFETATFPPAGWNMLDADGDGQNWFHYGAEGAAHTGLYSAGSASWTSTAGTLTPNNWLITPPIAIPATGDYKVEYYAAGQDPDFPDEHYGFYVSTTGTAPADFTLLFEETFVDAAWNYRMQNLASYAGQTVHFAFRHFNSSDVFYMKIDDVAVREILPDPSFSYTPAAWDFGDVQKMNPSTPKNFVLSNVGGETITINSGDIVLNDPNGNFVLTAANLPATLSGSTNYTFSVQFIPQSLGTKTATITIEDNLTRVSHTINLTGEAIAEPIVGIINLAGEAQLNNASLTWAGIYGSPGTPGYLHWDDTIMRGNVGAGASSYNVAVKFGTEAMAASAGMELTNVMIHLAAEPQTVDNLIIWTGTDAVLTPVAIAYTQAVSGLVVGWNNIVLTTPVTVSGTDAIYVGYHVNGIVDTFPASTDGLTAVPNRGNLVDLDGWTTLTGFNIAGNWLIHAYFDDVPEILSRRPAYVQPIPVVSAPISETHLRNLPIEARMTANVDRVLRGFNIYRDGLQINSNIVAAYSYLDEGLAAGTYSYAVQSVHYSANGLISDAVSVEILPPPAPIALPFTEDWASSDFATNMWTTGSANWAINTSNGAPAPSATFTWNPQVVDYSIALASYEFDATGVNSVQFSFDLALGNFSLDAENVMTWEIWDGTSWNTLGSYSSLDDDLGWTRFAYDVSTYASDRIFKIRFVASGEDSYEIDRWYLDNVHVAELPLSVAPVTDLSIAQAGTNVVLSWTAITGADWYYIYTSEDPYGTFAPLGYIDTAGVSLPASLLPADKAFVKVTAGAGPFPRGERLDNAPAAKRK